MCTVDTARLSLHVIVVPKNNFSPLYMYVDLEEINRILCFN